MTRRSTTSYIGRLAAGAAAATVAAGLATSPACSSRTITLGGHAPSDAGASLTVDASIQPSDSLPDAAETGVPLDAATDSGWPPVFGPAEAVPGMDPRYDNTDPTFTANQQVVFFLSDHKDAGVGGWDVYCASLQVDGGYGPAQLIAISGISTDQDEKSPVISSDGRTLWVSRLNEVAGTGQDIYQSTRQTVPNDCAAGWGTPLLADDLNSPQDDIARPLGNYGLTMPLGSRRDVDASTHYLTYLATRASIGARFSTFRETSELDAPGFNTADAFLTDDGLTVYFTRAQNELGDIFVARRTTSDGVFDPPLPLSINTAADERDPWLSPTGDILYFVSNRTGRAAIYQTKVVRPGS